MPASDESVVREAIRDRRLVRFRYKTTMRVVEPHLLGYDGQGHLTLSAWQRSGGSGVGWRDFHLAKVNGIAVTDQSFSGPRPDYNPGDKTIARVVCSL